MRKLSKPSIKIKSVDLQNTQTIYICIKLFDFFNSKFVPDFTFLKKVVMSMLLVILV